ncbi:MAG TPA: ABC transporter permease [Symbiobacteriaceae bacterium]|nr:ABC transporter permease [Symbiobacteriaceae bacterium]
MSALKYHFRLQAGGAALTVLLLPVAVTLFTNSRAGPLQFAELFWPLGAPVLMAALFSREWEGGTAEVLFSRPVSRTALLAGRVTVAAGLLLTVCLVGWGTLAVLGQPVGLGAVLKVVMPGALALGAVGLLVGTASRSSPAGYLVPTAWWLIDWFSGGSYTGRFYLLGPEKEWLLVLAGLALAATAGLLSRRAR